MKKVDFHIHTVSTIWDPSFQFDMPKLKHYVETSKLDAIAITNHNCFDIEQFKEIQSTLNILILPGIELSIENSHIIFIADEKQIIVFDELCKELAKLFLNGCQNISFEQLTKSNMDFSKYLIIPHYRKGPEISSELLNKLRDHIFAGEVNSPKKWYSCIKDPSSLTPLFFSDFRPTVTADILPAKSTYINCEQLTIPKLRHILKDKTKVKLTIEGKDEMFQVLNDGTCASSGLNVILGKRSSGKTHTLDAINDTYKEKGIKYIKQFDLIKKNSDDIFEEIINREHSDITDEYLIELKKIVESISKKDKSNMVVETESYIRSLKDFASNSEKSDIFSKTKIFNEELLDRIDFSELEELIKSFIYIDNNEKYKTEINTYIDFTKLPNLMVHLIKQFRKLKLRSQFVLETNILIKSIKADLGKKSSLNPIEDMDLKQIYTDIYAIKRFNELITVGGKSRELTKKSLYTFSLISSISLIKTATELNSIVKIKSTANIIRDCKTPYELMMTLIKNKDLIGLDISNLYKSFWNIKYEILNSSGKTLSGGEKAEYNLLAELHDSFKYDIVLIDELESSFDNIFINQNILVLIKDMSKKSTVFISTHNNSIGVLLEPECLIYTEKVMGEPNTEYYVYTGELLSDELKTIGGKTIKNYATLVDTMEAGEIAYDKRRQIYETIKN